jgi:hypothetical protein
MQVRTSMRQNLQVRTTLALLLLFIMVEMVSMISFENLVLVIKIKSR